MFIIARIAAQIIDLLVGFMILMITFLGILPLFSSHVGPAGSAVTAILLFLLLCFGIQYPFFKSRQTIGKAFFGLEFVSTKPEMPVTIPLLLHRELFCKLMSCYLICLPLLMGNPGGHESATGIQVVRRPPREKRGNAK